MFLNNNWILLEFLKTFIKVYVWQVFVNVWQNFIFFLDIMSDRFWKIICSLANKIHINSLKLKMPFHDKITVKKMIQNACNCCFSRILPIYLKKKIFFFFTYIYLIGIHSMQGWTATTWHQVTRKRRKRLKHTGNLFKRTYS